MSKICIWVKFCIVSPCRCSFVSLPHGFIILSLVFQNWACIVIVWCRISHVILVCVYVVVSINLQILLNGLVVLIQELVFNILLWLKLNHLFSHNFCDCFLTFSLPIVALPLILRIRKPVVLILILDLRLFPGLHNSWPPSRDSNNGRPSILVHGHGLNFGFSHKRIASAWPASLGRELLFVLID